MKNILLVKGKSGTPAFDASRNYIDEWAAALRKLGCNTYVLDGWSWAMPIYYHDMISAYQFDAVIDCNGVLMSLGGMSTGALPSEAIYGIYMHDHPGSLERLKYVDERTIVFNCDRQFCGYIDKYLPMIKHREFIPLSGSFYPEWEPFAKRTIDIIFTGKCPDPERTKSALTAAFQNEGMAEFGEDLMRDIVLHPENTFPECLSKMMKAYNLQLSDYEFNEYARKHFLVDYYVRDYYRDKIIRTLLDAGLEIHVFGNGWENASSRYSGGKLMIHDGGLYAAGRAVADAKIALNIMPWFKDGFQERIAAAMLSKAVAVTDESIYINNEFEDGKDLLIYSLKELDKLADRIKNLLAHPKEAAEIAENGYRKAQNHTWLNRVYDMLRKMEEDFGISFISDGEGRELEHKYSDRRLMLLDAAYELKRMADFAEQDVGKIEVLSGLDLGALMNKFVSFQNRFGELLNGMEMNPYFLDFMQEHGESVPGHAVELFAMQCKAIMSRLLLEINGLKMPGIGW